MMGRELRARIIDQIAAQFRVAETKSDRVPGTPCEPRPKATTTINPTFFELRLSLPCTLLGYDRMLSFGKKFKERKHEPALAPQDQMPSQAPRVQAATSTRSEAAAMRAMLQTRSTFSRAGPEYLRASRYRRAPYLRRDCS